MFWEDLQRKEKGRVKKIFYFSDICISFWVMKKQWLITGSCHGTRHIAQVVCEMSTLPLESQIPAFLIGDSLHQNGDYTENAHFKIHYFCCNNSEPWQHYKMLGISGFWFIPHMSTLSKNTLIFIGMTSWFNSSLWEAIFHICTWILGDILSIPERVTNANCCRLTYLAEWHPGNCRSAAISTM